ncbi:MAG: hypothetical protein ACRDND_30435 [Streptosporangiaceae bacterium]
MSGFAERGEAEEGVHCGEAGVAAADAVPALAFEMVEEGLQSVSDPPAGLAGVATAGMICPAPEGAERCAGIEDSTGKKVWWT